MSKIICDVCGTSFPDTATHCPICGSVRPAEPETVASGAAAGGYTYVKGGRFSKANVKKRNKGKAVATYAAEESDSVNRSSTGLIILLVVLLVIVALLVTFVVIAATNKGAFNGFGNSTTASQETEPSEVSVPCTSLTANFDVVTLYEPGETALLKISTTPLNTTDELQFASSDSNVATVDATGLVTYVGAGQAEITVTCGEAKTACQVICNEVEIVFTPEDFRLNRMEITFDMADSSWVLYNGEIPMEEISWSSDDEAVATISDGVVVAVGEGQTTVYGEFMGNKIGCSIICDFTSGGVSGGVSEDVGDSGSSTTSALHIYAKFFFSPKNYGDFTIHIKEDDTLTLMLADESGKEVEAAWSINAQPNASLIGSRVKGLIPGTTATVTATYKGQTYTCLIRILN